MQKSNVKKSTVNHVVKKLRNAADKMRETDYDGLVIPSEDGEKYPFGIQTGLYSKEQVVKGLIFLADMLEN